MISEQRPDIIMDCPNDNGLQKHKIMPLPSSPLTSKGPDVATNGNGKINK